MSKQAQNSSIVAIVMMIGVLLLTQPVSAKGEERAAVKPTSTPAASLKAKEDKRIEEKRQQVRETLKERAQELSTKLAPDKQEIAVKLAAKINAANQRLVGVYTRHLERLAQVLGKIETRSKILSNEELTQAIGDAQKALGDAKKAVAVQAAKTYAINLLETEKLGEAARAMYKQFVSDHQELRESALTEVSMAIKEALRLLKASVTPTP